MWFVENYDNKASLGLKASEKLYEKQSEFQKVEVFKTDFFGNLMTLDGLVMLSEKDEFVYHEMIVHMPLNTHKNPKSVLVVGGGDGGAVREILKHKSVEKVVLCEIDKEVVDVSRNFFPTVSSKLNDEKVEIVYEDGFKFLDNHKNAFDVIITDSSDPVGPGVELFKENYYKKVKESLKEGGIMVSQSESPWLYEETMKSMTNAMGKIFKNVQTYVAMVPLYPLGFWTISFASDFYRLENFDLKRSEEIAKSCKYYNPEIHKAALALPNFAKNIVFNR